MVFDVGRLCVKTAGRDSGRYCVIVDSLPNNYVLVTGPKPLTGVRRRKCNIDHLRPLPHSVKLKKDSPDSDVLSAFEKDGVYKVAFSPQKYVNRALIVSLLAVSLLLVSLFLTRTKKKLL